MRILRENIVKFWLFGILLTRGLLPLFGKKREREWDIMGIYVRKFLVTHDCSQKFICLQNAHTIRTRNNGKKDARSQIEWFHSSDFPPVTSIHIWHLIQWTVLFLLQLIEQSLTLSFSLSHSLTLSCFNKHR